MTLLLKVLESVAICILLLALTLVAFAHKIHILPGTYLVHIVPGIPYLVCILPGIPYLVAGTYIIPGTYHQREAFLRLHNCRRPSRSTNPVPAQIQIQIKVQIQIQIQVHIQLQIQIQIQMQIVAKSQHQFSSCLEFRLWIVYMTLLNLEVSTPHSTFSMYQIQHTGSVPHLEVSEATFKFSMYPIYNILLLFPTFKYL